MSLFNVSFDDFGGLDLASDPDATGGSIDLLNVDLDRPGRIRSRDGFARVTAAAGATRYDSIFPLAGTTVASTSMSAGTVVDDASHGSIAWSTPGSGHAVAVLPAAQRSHYLKATNFGFSVPGTATIVGITASITRVVGPGGTLNDDSIRIVKAGVVVGTDLSTGEAVTYPSYLKTYGSATNLWGSSWTPADINASTFGFVYSALNPNATTLSGVISGPITLTVYYVPAASAGFVAGAAGSRLDVIAGDGTVAATLATASDTQQSYAAFGSPSTNSTYIANRAATVRKLVGTTFSQPAGMPKAKFVALQTPDNRLVAANIAVIPTGSGATASTSLVHFSDAGAPETWGANNYIYLTPGDNEDIQGAVAWRNQLLIFKSTKFFVFYGNSTDGTGQPIFNYRQVTGAGLAAPLATAVSPDGVYFLDRRGIYFTNGGAPAKISGAIDALFIGGIAPYFQAGIINPSAFAQASMCWYSGRLYIGLPLGTATTNDHTLVFDPANGQWVLWDIPMGAMASSASQPASLLFTYATGTNDIGQYAPNAYTDDAGTAITARYRSAFQSFDWRGRNLRSGIHNVEKIVRESMVDGSGSVAYSLSNQWTQPASIPASRTLTLGTAPQIKQSRDRTAVKGRAFSFQVSGTGPWSVEKVVLALHGYEEAGLKETGN